MRFEEYSDSEILKAYENEFALSFGGFFRFLFILIVLHFLFMFIFWIALLLSGLLLLGLLGSVLKSFSLKKELEREIKRRKKISYVFGDGGFRD